MGRLGTKATCCTTENDNLPELLISTKDVLILAFRRLDFTITFREDSTFNGPVGPQRLLVEMNRGLLTFQKEKEQVKSSITTCVVLPSSSPLCASSLLLRPSSFRKRTPPPQTLLTKALLSSGHSSPPRN